MKKTLIMLGAAALTLTACNQQPYRQQAQACDPTVQDCYGYGVGHDQTGHLLAAAALGAGAGYLAGRMHHDHDYYDHGHYGYHHGYGYHAPAPQVVNVHNHYYGTAGSTASAPVTPQRTAPISLSKPASRTMFGSARRH